MTYWPPRLVDDLKDLGFRTRDQAVEVIMRLQCERNNLIAEVERLKAIYEAPFTPCVHNCHPERCEACAT